MQTDRIVFRHFTLQDYDDFRYYAIQPDVGINAGWKPHESAEETHTILQQFINDSQIYALQLKQTGKVIGSIGIHEKKDGGRVGNYREIGYVLSHDYWGQGLMTEAVKAAVQFAFETYLLDYIIIAAFDDNIRSHRVAEKCGFEKEGTIHFSAKRYDGKVLNTVWFILTRERYKQIYQKN